GVRLAMYRPFTREYVYLGRHIDNTVYQLPRLVPADAVNWGFYVNGTHSSSEFAVLAMDSVPCLDIFGKGGQFFPRYSFEDRAADNSLFAGLDDDGRSYRRIDNVTDEILAEYQETFGTEVKKDDIFFYLY